MTLRMNLIKIVNVLLAVFYILGALVIIFPNQHGAIPNEFGYISVGILLLTTGLFGSAYYTEGDQ